MNKHFGQVDLISAQNGKLRSAANVCVYVYLIAEMMVHEQPFSINGAANCTLLSAIRAFLTISHNITAGRNYTEMPPDSKLGNTSTGNDLPRIAFFSKWRKGKTSC